MVKRIVIASTAGWRTASTQYRLGPLARAGPWPCDAVDVPTFPSADDVGRLLGHADDATVLVLRRVLPSPRQVDRLRSRFSAIAFDMDDAIYATPPRVGNPRVRESLKRIGRLVLRGDMYASSRRRPLTQVLPLVDVCVVGNAILGDFARRHTQRVEEIPTTVEPTDRMPEAAPRPPVVVWVGLPANLQYLALVRRALQRVAREDVFRLRIVSARPWDERQLPFEFVQWSPEAADEAMLTASVGIAPLTDDAWTRGKCAFRAIQYGAHVLPTIASPVGVTDQVVIDGRTGILARTEGEWAAALVSLLRDPPLAKAMGQASLAHITERYSHSVAIARWTDVISDL